MNRKLIIVGCSLWILGLAAAILGLNLSGTTGTWLTVIGNICFLVGLGLTAIVRYKNWKHPDE